MADLQSLPYSFTRIADNVPEPVLRAAEDAGLNRTLSDGPLGVALRRTASAEFSELEWGALIEAEAIIGRLKNQDEDIQINYRGPAVEGLKTGINELPINLWANWFGVPMGYRVLLFSLVRQLRPRMCLELGTAAGFSALYLAQGLVLNGQGELRTVEEDAGSHAVGSATLWTVRDYARSWLGPLDEVLDELLPEASPLDLVLVAGLHDSGDNVRYAARLSEHLGPGALVVYNAIHWSKDAHAAWEEIRTRQEVDVSLNLGGLGIVQVKTTGEDSPAFYFTAEIERDEFGDQKLPISGVRPENLTWIFGSPRSGTTWLRDMMQTAEDSKIWEEPFVGDLFGNFYYERAQEGQLKARTFIMGEPIRPIWIRGIRKFVLEVSKGRFPEIEEHRRVIVKEPSGSIGAPLLLEAFPESRMVLLVRDPRDVAASYLDASRKDAWLYNRRSHGWIKESEYADRDPDRFVERIAEEYVRHVGNALEAYEAHAEGRKALLRYEDLVADTPDAMRRVYQDLGMEVGDGRLTRAVHKHSWENIPQEKKGEGKFYRKGEPGSWREDLTPKQAQIVERVTEPLLNRFYPGWGDEDGGV